VPVRDVKFRREAIGGQGIVLALGLVCLFGSAVVRAQSADATLEKASNTRLLTVEEGRAIADTALQQEQPERGTQDCSHLIHQIYLDAGFEYSYASSFELFSGHENFARVRFPRAGDLIVWPGHVGIVVDPKEHTFSSLVSTGLDVQDYEGAYWRSRGRPHFYRYKVENGRELSASKIHGMSQDASIRGQQGGGTVMEERVAKGNRAVNQPPKTASERTVLIYGPPAPAEVTETDTPYEVPSSVIIAAGSKPPTREEVAEGISELNDAAGNLLRTNDPFKSRSPVVIVEQFSVARVEIKRDHGWARLQIESKVSIDGGTIQRKERRENASWELRRTPTGWEVVTPPNRTFVPHDVAAKQLAAQLARLTQSDGAAAHQGTVLQEESQIASLLGALLIQ
jgi:hypothetical protein